MSENLKFNEHVFAIREAHETLSIQASKAFNLCLTIRKWLIGNYINEYELRGRDRAGYAEFLFESLALIKQALNAWMRVNYDDFIYLHHLSTNSGVTVSQI